VTWTVNSVIASVYVENIAAGSGDVAFTLEIDYLLAALAGRVRGVSSVVTAQRGVYGAAYVRGEAFIELLQNGRVVAKTYTDLDGSYAIDNLLPGEYHMRAYNGIAYSRAQKVTLGEGQTLEIEFSFELLRSKDVYNYPNPCRDTTVLRFFSDCVNIEAQILLYTITGELVREITGSELVVSGAEYSYVWDLRNMHGEELSSGVYLYQVKLRNKETKETATATKKIAIIR